AFWAKNVNDAMGNLYGTADNTPSNKISIVAPATAEAGTPVTVTVETGMAATAIAIVVERNSEPLAANFVFAHGAQGFVETSVVICQTSDIIIVVKSGGKLYTGRRNVKVSGECATAAAAGGKLKGKKSIRAQARANGNVVEVAGTINHPMGAQHITEVTAVHNGLTIVTAQWGPHVAAKPRLGLRFSGGAKGDAVDLTWVDKQGRTDTTSLSIK
ncbi:MAG: thiosulfate oxidation carrier complex protein SoxZ, partial [Alphaproteobacteria bacterium]|nr:thiosulfate oxidation carrier complex protein SoxZ [Alphaproteobacteria bacterium]